MPDFKSLFLFLILAPIAAAEPYQNGSVGFALDLPDGASVTASNANPPSCLISGGQADNVWHLRLDRGANPEGLTTENIALELKSKHSDPNGTEIIQNQAVYIDDTTGHWILIHEKGSASEAFFGWLVLPLKGEQYIAANLLTTESGWRLHSKAISSMIASIMLLDPAALIQERLERIEHSSNLLNSLNESTLSSLLTIDEWRRITMWNEQEQKYQDIGYLHLVCWKGPPSAIENFDTRSESEDSGLIVSVQSRLVSDESRGIVVDTVAQFWMSFDGKREQWKKQTKRWMDGAQVMESETGILIPAKLGQPRTKLRVFSENLTSMTINDPYEVAIESPWLPKALHWVLPELLAKQQNLNFFWKTFENAGDMKQITTRIDQLKRSNNAVQIDTSFGEQGVIFETVLSNNGKFLSQKQAGGLRIEQSSQAELAPIWTPRNLW